MKEIVIKIIRIGMTLITLMTIEVKLIIILIELMLILIAIEVIHSIEKNRNYKST